jgi:hypothetical protein
METYYDSQLVIGPYESAHFSPAEITSRIEAYVQTVPTRRLIIWNSQGDRWFEQVIELCSRNHIEPYLWYPVLADRMDRRIPLEDEQARSATLQTGYGKLGCWEGFVGNDENFLFHCPEHSIDIDSIGYEIETTLSRFGFAGVFLDRIRYPSPANGLEMVFSCFCDRCLNNGYEKQRTIAEHALEALIEYSLQGREVDWATFVSECNLGDLMDRRSKAITKIVMSIGNSLDRSKYAMGLDLLSPALASLVGQSYKELAQNCDWIKAMTYVKAIGPAGLPLEALSMVKGLQQLHPRITQDQASRLTESLLGLPRLSMQGLTAQQGFPVGVLQAEIERAQVGADPGVAVIPGIELVDHPVFPTKVPFDEARLMIDVIKKMNSGVITCWNLLYIPPENYRYLAEYEGVGRS